MAGRRRQATGLSRPHRRPAGHRHAARGDARHDGFNLAVTLRESARRVPGKPAMILGGTRISYAELDVLSDRIAADGLAGVP